MDKKNQADLIVMIVLFVSGLLAIASAVAPQIHDLFTGASILFAAAMVCRAMQWAGKE